MNTRSERILRAVLCSVLSSSLVSMAQAQAAPASTTSREEAVALEKFVVTGTLIPIAAGSPAIPVKTLAAADIERTGLTTDLADVLRRNQPTFYGNNNVGTDRANIDSGDSNGGSALSLRNRSTLVLINGRRANFSPALATGGLAFVDISMIPMAAVERIEILSDGASATYGSDAVSGVINVILKTNYSGAEVGGSYGFSTNEGNWENRSLNLVAGGSSGNTNLTVAMEWKRSDPLIQYERPFSVGQFRTPTYAGVVSIGNDYYYLNPSSNAPAGTLDLSPSQLVAQGIYQGPLTQDEATKFFDLASYPTLLQDAERRSFMAALEHKLNNNLSLFADGIYSINNTESVLNAQPVSGTVAATSPLNPFNVAVTARNRFVTYPRVYANESISMRGIAGLRGRFSDSWTYEGAVNLNKTNHYFRNKNLIDGTKYAELVAANTYNPFARAQAPGIVESMSGTQVRDYVSTFRSLDARISGDAFEIPGGPVKVGVGVQFGWTELDFTNDRNDQTGNWLQATPRQPFNEQMNQDGYFAEVRIPVFSEKNSIRGAHTLELTVAARKEIYSNTEDPLVPKYALRYLPFNNDLAFRASYSESFVAPTLYEQFGPQSVGFTSSININRYAAADAETGAARKPCTTGARRPIGIEGLGLAGRQKKDPR